MSESESYLNVTRDPSGRTTCELHVVEGTDCATHHTTETFDGDLGEEEATRLARTIRKTTQPDNVITARTTRPVQTFVNLGIEPVKFEELAGFVQLTNAKIRNGAQLRLDSI